MLLSCGLGHSQGSIMLWHLIKVKGSSPHKPSAFTPIIQYSPCFTKILISLLNIASRYQSTSSTNDLLSDYLHPLSHNHFSSFIILRSLHTTEPRENIFINPFVHPFRYSTQLLYSCIRYFIHSRNTQQTSEVIHLDRPNPRPFLYFPHRCLTTIYKNSHE